MLIEFYVRDKDTIASKIGTLDVSTGDIIGDSDTITKLIDSSSAKKDDHDSIMQSFGEGAYVFTISKSEEPNNKLANIAANGQKRSKSRRNTIEIHGMPHVSKMLLNQQKRIKIRFKGGPASGHWGHMGRPGKRGGSLPGSMMSSNRVNPDWFTVGPGRKLTENLHKTVRKRVIDALTMEASDVRSVHMGGLTEISDKSPYDDPDSFLMTEEDYGNGSYSHLVGTEAGGVYSPSKKSVHLNTGNDQAVSRSTLLHELGHHQEYKMSTLSFAHIDQAKINLAEKLRISSYVGKPSKQWSVAATNKVFEVGLRPYSFNNTSEFIADTYKLTAMTQWNKLTESISKIEGHLSSSELYGSFSFSKVYNEGESPYD